MGVVLQVDLGAERLAFAGAAGGAEQVPLDVINLAAGLGNEVQTAALVDQTGVQFGLELRETDLLHRSVEFRKERQRQHQHGEQRKHRPAPVEVLVLGGWRAVALGVAVFGLSHRCACGSPDGKVRHAIRNSFGCNRCDACAGRLREPARNAPETAGSTAFPGSARRIDNPSGRL